MKADITPIKDPRITEKASNLSGGDVYTFNVSSSANKKEVEKAIFAIYKVKPVKVNILKVQRKSVFWKGRTGARGGGKKAVVYLKKGDKIEFV